MLIGFRNMGISGQEGVIPPISDPSGRYALRCCGENPVWANISKKGTDG